MLGQTASQANTGSFTIASFNQTTFVPVSSITLDNLEGGPIAMVRWGTSGLAILTANAHTGNFGGAEFGGVDGMLYILQDNAFVSSRLVPAPAAMEQPVLQRWARLTKRDMLKRFQQRVRAGSAAR